ncbi:hypothetical protein [Anaerostipes caccae]|uniref:hypothetical protein n=1 Tax=Anaerostipes caccae TaxID=105841 RepID=UPI0038D40A38
MQKASEEMYFEYIVDENLPKLAWCAKLKKGEERVTVKCGKQVEIFRDWFIEGAWNGSFYEGKFEESTFLLGTGGKVDNNKILFSTPSHTLERLHFIRTKGDLYISNSFAFVLEATNTSLNFKYLDYEKAFHSILLGIDQYQKTIPLAQKDAECFVCYYTNIIIDKNLSIIYRKKKEVSSFSDYHVYKKSLDDSIAIIKENIVAEERKKKYGVITTISSGYDSAACAAIAKTIGCNTAVTFNQPDKYASDSGEDIAHVLGYENIISKNADSYKKRKDLIEAEYVSGGELGTGIVFSAFDEEFKDKLVFIGEGGDRLWDRNVSDVNDKIRFINELYSGSTLIEPRLRLGYIYLPLPFYGATCWPSIYAINHSVEMESWTMHNSYDRPIARRIVEEAGVPRQMFGVEKIGAGFNYRFDTLKRMRGRMSETSYKDFCNYYHKHKSFSIKRFIRIVRYLFNTMPAYINYVLRKAGIKKRIKDKNTRVIKVENPLAVSYMFHWGIENTKKRYR